MEIGRASGWRPYATLLLPPLAWVLLFLILPYGLLFACSFWKLTPAQTIAQDWNLQNYLHLFRNAVYLRTLGRSAAIAAAVTLLSLLLAFPVAYWLAFQVKRHKKLWYMLAIIPLWISYLVRAYAWKTILGTGGVLNAFLVGIGVTDQPIAMFLYSPVAVIITLTHIYTPFVLMPVYAMLEQIPPALLEAAEDLGAGPWRTFTRVVLPLSMPGVVAGCTFAFVLSLGDFLSPLLVGGPTGIMISNIVVSLFGAAYNWPLGAAISLVMLLLVLAIITLANRLEARTKYV